MANKKYEFTGEMRDVWAYGDPKADPIKVQRIRSLREIIIPVNRVLGKVVRIPKGYEGGWIESENNLSQKGECWVGDEACVCGDTVISDNAFVTDTAWVHGLHTETTITDSAVQRKLCIGGTAVVCGSATINGYISITDNTTIKNRASIGGYDIAISGCTRIEDDARVFGHGIRIENSNVVSHARVCDSACIKDGVMLHGMSCVSDCASISGKWELYHNVVISSNAEVVNTTKKWLRLMGAMNISTDASITHPRDVVNICFADDEEGSCMLTFYRDKSGTIHVSTYAPTMFDQHFGTLDDFIAKYKKKYKRGRSSYELCASACACAKKMLS